MFDQLFSAAMEQADMGIDPPHHLTVQFQYKAQHPVRRRVLRSKIDREIAEPSFGGHARLVPPLVSPMKLSLGLVGSYALAGRRPETITNRRGHRGREPFGRL